MEKIPIATDCLWSDQICLSIYLSRGRHAVQGRRNIFKSSGAVLLVEFKKKKLGHPKLVRSLHESR